MSRRWIGRTNAFGILISLLFTPAACGAFGYGASGVGAPAAIPSTSMVIVPPVWAGGSAAWPDEMPSVEAPWDLARFIAEFRASLDRLAEWVRVFPQMVSDTLTRMIWESPGLLPEGADLEGLARQIAALPQALRGPLEAVLGKLAAAGAPGAAGERHHAYIEGNPATAHEAMGIVETDEVVVGGAVQQRASSEATAAVADAVSRDLRPSLAAAQGDQAGRLLVSAAQDLPSSRAGIELLVAGVGAGLREQADLGAAAADRLTVLVQQTAQLSQQVGALAATTGALTLRQAEQDRRALDAQLEFADTVSTAANLLVDAVTDAGETRSPEPPLRPLY